MRRLDAPLLLSAALVACAPVPDANDGAEGSSGAAQTTVGLGSTSDEGMTTSTTEGSGSTAGTAGASTTGPEAADTGVESSESTSTGSVVTDARGWILDHFADDPVLTGEFDSRTLVEVPRLVLDSTGRNAKYAFTPRNEEGPEDKRVGFVDVSIVDLVSPDIFGAGIGTSNDDTGTILYLDEVYIEPNWPTWVDYATTNYDGIVLDGAAAIYGEDVTIANWNADAAIDNKAPISQFVRLVTHGTGHRAIRYWRSGPHYLVESSIENLSGAVMWFAHCDDTTVYIYDSTFNGEPEVPADRIQCDEGTAPNLVYLEADPRDTGEMHPMFSWPVE